MLTCAAVASAPGVACADGVCHARRVRRGVVARAQTAVERGRGIGRLAETMCCVSLREAVKTDELQRRMFCEN